MFHKGLLNCMFLYCYSPYSNYLLAQAPRANFYHPSIPKTLEWSAIPLMDFKNEFENKVGIYIPELEAGVFKNDIGDH
jgi:hypothetical protein